MAETLAILAGLGILIVMVAMAVYGIGFLVLATPVMRWVLILMVALLALKVVLLPFTYLSIWVNGHPDVILEAEVRAKTVFVLTTRIVPTRRSSRFTLLAEGTVTNNAQQSIKELAIECRISKLSFGDSERAYHSFAVSVMPGETKPFSAILATDLTGIAVTGHLALQPPDQHFCRLDRVQIEQ
jgi:hypothetical protein